LILRNHCYEIAYILSIVTSSKVYIIILNNGKGVLKNGRSSKNGKGSPMKIMDRFT
jgi:hypothetical protein